MKKNIQIGNQVVEMNATALTPILYKQKFGKDIFRDSKLLSSEDTFDTVIVCQIAYSMVKTELPFNEWLEQFEITDVIASCGEIIGLWGLNQSQNSIPRKK